MFVSNKADCDSWFSFNQWGRGAAATRPRYITAGGQETRNLSLCSSLSPACSSTNQCQPFQVTSPLHHDVKSGYFFQSTVLLITLMTPSSWHYDWAQYRDLETAKCIFIIFHLWFKPALFMSATKNGNKVANSKSYSGSSWSKWYQAWYILWKSN